MRHKMSSHSYSHGQTSGRRNSNLNDTPNTRTSRSSTTVIQSNRLRTCALSFFLAFYSAFTASAADACIPSPSGIVSWWRGEGNASDQAATNNGVMTGNATFGPGHTGQGFVLDGNADLVFVGNPESLRLQNL